MQKLQIEYYPRRKGLAAISETKEEGARTWMRK